MDMVVISDGAVGGIGIVLGFLLFSMVYYLRRIAEALRDLADRK